MENKNGGQAALGIEIYYFFGGCLLTVIGIVLLFDQLFNIQYTRLLLLPLLGITLYIVGINKRSSGFINSGSLISVAGIGWLIISSGVIENQSIEILLGLFIVVFSCGWFFILFSPLIIGRSPNYWSLLPGFILLVFGMNLLVGEIDFISIFISVVIGTSISLLLWGWARKKMGLIIPGCLLAGIGSGVFFAWYWTVAFSELTRFSFLLICFGLSWIVISGFYRLMYQNFVWWPLIPGAIIIVVGWGLYIGGNPTDTGEIVGNMGSISLIVFGLYLLLMRNGFRK